VTSIELRNPTESQPIEITQFIFQSASQNGHGRDAVGSNVQMDIRIGIAEGFLRQSDITGTVFDQENFHGHSLSSCGFHDFT
jgi:hypothetical protein